MPPPPIQPHAFALAAESAIANTLIRKNALHEEPSHIHQLLYSQFTLTKLRGRRTDCRMTIH